MNDPYQHAGNELDYFEKRAEAELELAQSATHPGAVRAHYQLADLYLEIVHGDGGEAPPGPGDIDDENGRAGVAR